MGSQDSLSAAMPAPLTPFVGREREVKMVRQRLLNTHTRLLTLLGTGSTQTRLALQVASTLLDTFPDGISFVPLAALTDAGLVVPTIAQALGVVEAGTRPLLESVKPYVCNQHAMLILDNFEQVLDAAPAIATLLAAAPRLTVLVTSRAALHVAGEREFPVPPLATPDLTARPSPASLAQYDAVRLFVARAQDVKPDFALTKLRHWWRRSADGWTDYRWRSSWPRPASSISLRRTAYSPTAPLPGADRRGAGSTGTPADDAQRHRLEL